jgi:hypothetical protein
MSDNKWKLATVDSLISPQTQFITNMAYTESSEVVYDCTPRIVSVLVYEYRLLN